MAETVTLKLTRDLVGQILDGLEVLIEQWEATQTYMEGGLVSDDVAIRDCSEPEEAEKIANYYRRVAASIEAQLAEQPDS